MDNQTVIQHLEQMVGTDQVTADQEVLQRQSVDYVGYRNWERYNNRYHAKIPICIVKPKTVEQVVEVICFLNEHKIIAIPRTGGSSSTASIEVIDPNTVIVDGSAMNEIIQVSKENMQCTVQCGVALEYLEEYLNKMGVTTGHFPQSLPMAQIGGLVATRSIGQFSTLYGGIEDMVVGLQAVLGDGQLVRIKNVPRRAAGPDIRQILVGNEGTLAFITEITLKLFPYLPEQRWKNAYAVGDMDTGLNIIREIMVSGYKPAVLRLHDDYEASSDYPSFVKEGESLLLFIAEGSKDQTDTIGAGVDRICKKHGAREIGEEPLDVWLTHRNDLCDEMDELKLYKQGVVVETCEISAVWTEIGKIYHTVLSRIKKEIDSIVYICGHSSHSYINGTNIYFKFGFKAFETDEKSREEYFKIMGIIMEETLRLEGSIAHHHGIGKYRAKWSADEHGSAYDMLVRLKKAFDPNSIMNKGTLLP